MRAEFIRLAIRRAIDLSFDRTTALAYEAQPLAGGILAADLTGWDAQNALAEPMRVPTRRRRTLHATRAA